MRLTTGSSRAGALLFLPLALALGCNRSNEVVPTADNDKPVNVVLDGTLTPIPSPNPVSPTKKQRVRWDYCGKGSMDIWMKDEPSNDPFDGYWERWDDKNGCQHFRSPKIKGDAREKKDPSYKPYRYTILVVIGNEYHINDPDIEIMP